MFKKAIWHFLISLHDENFTKEYREVVLLKNKQQLKNLEDEKLKSLLLHAYKETNYYKKIFDQINIIKNNKVDLNKFQKIPILTKEIIRKNQNDLKRNNFDKHWSFENSSGGSTGEPLKIWQDKNYKKWHNAARIYYFKKLLHIDEERAKKILLWGSERDLLKGDIGLEKKITNFFLNTTILNTFKVSKEKMKEYLDIINKQKPNFIRGYAGSLYELANFVQKNN
ncbi:MAG: phenylacetate--CoA ligase family protein, partial [Patescibacteria group bacterium]|nr:phenylacetate--CoA ligase family protein [Patescibacteria group bacterium]